MHDEIVIEDLISPDERGMGELVLKGFEVHEDTQNQHPVFRKQYPCRYVYQLCS